jgi:uncharacterized protein YxjI
MLRDRVNHPKRVMWQHPAGWDGGGPAWEGIDVQATIATGRAARGGAGGHQVPAPGEAAEPGDDFWIENDRGERVFKVDDKVLRARDTVIIKDTNGKELYKLQKRLLRARDTMAIERGGDKVATVKKAFVTPVRDRFTVDLEGGGDLEVEGNILDHEYQITRGGVPVANISKRWFRVRDSYGVAVAGQDDALVLAVTVCIDHLTSHDR